MIIHYRGNAYPVRVSKDFLASDSYYFEVSISGLKKQYSDDRSHIKKLLEKSYLDYPDKLRKLLFEANLYYNVRQLDKCFEKLEEAEQAFPGSHLVKTMKGSLLYLLGAPEIAISKWEESLDIYKEQKELVQFMERVLKRVDKNYPRELQEKNTKEIKTIENKNAKNTK